MQIARKMIPSDSVVPSDPMIPSQSLFANCRCFDFVNAILQQTPYWEHFQELHRVVQIDIPESHKCVDLIPYHFSLIARKLQSREISSEFVCAVPLCSAQPGDIFVYIDIAYDPDPSKRKVGTPSGTHVGFIDEIVMQNIPSSDFCLRLIDASRRRKNRFISTDTSEKNALKGLAEGSAISYSFIRLQKSETNDVWNCELHSKQVESKKVMVFVLRLNKIIGSKGLVEH